jgi:hypothetical protein
MVLMTKTNKQTKQNKKKPLAIVTCNSGSISIFVNVINFDSKEKTTCGFQHEGIKMDACMVYSRLIGVFFFCVCVF